MLGLKPARMWTALLQDRWIDLTAVGRTDPPVRFEFPDSLAWNQPVELGQALAKFLRSQKLAIGQVALGLPARWLMAQHQDIPSTDRATVNGALQLTVSRQFSGDAARWTFDYLATSHSQGTSALLVGIDRQRLEHIRQTFAEAGLTIKIITSPAMAAVSMTALRDQDGSVAHLRWSREEAVLLVRRPTGIAAMTYLSSHETNIQRIALDIRRWLLPLTGGFKTLRVEDSSSPSSADALPWTELGRLLELEIQLQPQPVTEAAALLWAATHRQSSVDFAQSRLMTGTEMSWSRQRLLALTAGIVLLLGVGGWAYDWYDQSRQADRITAELTGMKKRLDSAQDQINRLTLVRGWFDRRPACLQTLLQITDRRPANGHVWLTSLSWRDDGTATLSGKAIDEAAVIDLIGRLGQSPDFHDVKLLYMRQAERGRSTISFALSLGAKP